MKTDLHVGMQFPEPCGSSDQFGCRLIRDAWVEVACQVLTGALPNLFLQSMRIL